MDGEILVIEDLNLDVARGETLTTLGPSGSGTTLGPSGSGKSALLMMLAGFEPANRGENTLDGQPIDSVAPH